MAHRSPTLQERERAAEYNRNGIETTQRRIELLEYIGESDFDEEYKQAAHDLILYHAYIFVQEDLLPEGLDEQGIEMWKAAALAYQLLPIKRRMEIETGPSVSTIRRLENGQTAMPRPLTEIKIATALGLPCMPLLEA